MPTLTNWQIALLIGGAIGLIFGVVVARKSAKEKAIQGGMMARLFHYLGTAAFVAVAPTVLVGSILYKLNFFPRVIRGLGLGFGLLAISALCLIIYAAFEVQATKQKAS